ncbi:alpha/beta hydrolase [Sphaerisporangium sp. NBC_01403]|uniref:alpha/beta fold hydrolase n=1 Tax=Sphaerisporangium sp. NBC_01403 TaxID=2903599 RepID=UPI003246AF63
MATESPQPLDIPVDGGELRALRWGTGDAVILAAHGITGSAASWQAVAGHLPAGWSLIAVDLRGRGGSTDLPGPFGFDRHSADLNAAAHHIGAGQYVLTGHSMGAYVALLAAVRSPEPYRRLVLVDGGIPLPVPEGLDPDVVMRATLGPALARLSRTFDSVEEYFDFWRAHPAFKDSWSDDLEFYLRYDLTGEPGALRSRAQPSAVRADGHDLLSSGQKINEALRALKLPTVLLTAPNGMMGDPPPFLPPALVAEAQAQSPSLDAEVVPDTNHYTILFNPPAAQTVMSHLTT